MFAGSQTTSSLISPARRSEASPDQRDQHPTEYSTVGQQGCHRICHAIIEIGADDARISSTLHQIDVLRSLLPKVGPSTFQSHAKYDLTIMAPRHKWYLWPTFHLHRAFALAPSFSRVELLKNERKLYLCQPDILATSNRERGR